MEIFATSPFSEEALRFVLLGMATGSLTALVALGIVLVYRTSGVLNFSAGALGGIAAFFFYDIRDDGYPTWWALTFSLAVGVLLGLLTYAVLASLRNASQLSKLIATLGLFSAGQAFMVLRWGGGIVQPRSMLPSRVVTLWGDLTIGLDRLLLIGIALACAAVLRLVYSGTLFGLATSAVAENRRVAAAAGWSPSRIELLNFAVAGGLSALAAILLAPIITLNAAVLSIAVIPALAAALVGRFSSFGVTVLAALGIGIVQSEISLFQPDIADADDAEPHQAAELAGLDDEAASTAAVALAQVDILRAHPPLGFIHPLIRAAVYESLTLTERDRGHARAAQLLDAAGAGPERVAAHLLRTAPTGDQRVVATLREAARRAGSRGAADSAIGYLRRSLAEPPPDEDRAELLFELGCAEALLSGDDTVEHLQAAHSLLADPIRRAQTALMLGRSFLHSHPDEADRVFTQALDELGGADPELERLLEVSRVVNALPEPHLTHRVTDRLERIRSRSERETGGEKKLLATVAYHDALAGEPTSVGLPRRALAGGTLLTREDLPATALSRSGLDLRPVVLATAVLAAADLDEALLPYSDAVAAAHRSGSVLALAEAKGSHLHALVFRGELAEAEAEGRQAVDACAAWGTPWSYPAAFLADTLMEQGKLDDATAVLTRAGSEPKPDSGSVVFLRDSRARPRILRGDLAGGLDELFEVGRLFAAVGGRNPALVAWRSHAALALLQLGEHAEARRLATEELALAHAWGAPRALSAALRALGLVEGGRKGLASLEQAVHVVANSPAKLEHAKARTELGAALHRASRRTQAREHLRRALELATRCGAAPLAARAEIELRATGARPRRIALSGLESLTPSERRVAELAAHGPTNREKAQALFVTPRTVEVHLTNAYRKLGISSRSQLATALNEPTWA